MINLLFAGNTGVFAGIFTCVLSVLKRSRLTEPVNVYVMTMDASRIEPRYLPITREQTDFLERSIKRYGKDNSVTRIDVGELYLQYFSGCPNEDAYCSPYTLLRLFADLCDLPDKLLYLDADVLFNRDVHELYDIDVGEVEYAAARDHYGKFLVNPNYINAGVLLLNMKRMRETGIFERARVLIQTKKLPFADQSALIRSTTSKKLLPQKFNDQKFLHKNTVVRHFSKRLFWLPYPHTENIKQWQIDKVHEKFGYRQFDDILNEYFMLEKEFTSEDNNEKDD